MRGSGGAGASTASTGAGADDLVTVTNSKLGQALILAQ
jgi:hypothetical protein